MADVMQDRMFSDLPVRKYFVSPTGMTCRKIDHVTCEVVCDNADGKHNHKKLYIAPDMRCAVLVSH